MENPFVSPESGIVNDDEKVVALLVEHPQQMKVINILREEGMEYSDAKDIVANNVKPAQAILNKTNIFWKIPAWICILTGTIVPVITYLGGQLTIFSVGPLFLGLFCFNMCKKIRF